MNTAKKTAYISLITAVALLFSYVETLFPPIAPFPGFKLGLTNIITIFSLYFLGLKWTALITIIRCIIISLLFTGISGFAFSVVGSSFAIISMFFLLKHKNSFSIYGISVAGATAHNIGQIIVAVILVGSGSVVAFLPFLMICSVITGFFIAFISSHIIKKFKPQMNKLKLDNHSVI